MSETATLTRLPGDLRTASMTLAGVTRHGHLAGSSLLSMRCERSQRGSSAASERDGILASPPASGRLAVHVPHRRPRRAPRRRRAVRLRRAVRQVARAGARCAIVLGPHGGRRRGAGARAAARAARRRAAARRWALAAQRRASSPCTGSRSSPRSRCRPSRSALLGFASFPCSCSCSSGCCSDAAGSVPEARDRAAGRRSGLALLVPAFDVAERHACRASPGASLSGFTFALLAVRNRAQRERARRRARRSRCGRTRSPRCASCRSSLRQARPAVRRHRARRCVLIVLLGVVCTALAHTLFIAPDARLSAHTASVVTALEPVYGIALAAALLGESPDLRDAVPAWLLIVAAALLATRHGDAVASRPFRRRGWSKRHGNRTSSGWAAMGGNMARRLARAGVRVVGFDPELPSVGGARRRAGDRAPRRVVQRWCCMLPPPRVVWLMVPARQRRPSSRSRTSGPKSAAGDVIVDGGPTPRMIAMKPRGSIRSPGTAPHRLRVAA